MAKDTNMLKTPPPPHTYNTNQINQKIAELETQNAQLTNALQQVANAHNSLAHITSRLTPQAFLNILQFSLVEHCNLGCYGCSVFSQVADESFYDV